MDGRVQAPVTDWLKNYLGIDFIDVITEPGPDRIISCHRQNIVRALKEKCSFSIRGHGSNVLAIAGHHDCAGNIVKDGVHRCQILESVAVIASWGFGVRVIGLWVDEKYDVHLIYDSEI